MTGKFRMSRRVIDLLKYLEREVAGISRFLQRELENEDEQGDGRGISISKQLRSYKIVRRTGREADAKKCDPLSVTPFPSEFRDRRAQ